MTDYALIGLLAARDEIKTDDDAVTLAARLREAGYRHVVGPEIEAHREQIRQHLADIEARERAEVERAARLGLIDEILATGRHHTERGIRWGVSDAWLRNLRTEIEEAGS